jgi:hypothetical protein
MPGLTKLRGTPAGERSPEAGCRVEDGKSARWNRHEGRKWETTTAPDGGKASKCESRERCREKTLSAWSGWDQPVTRVEPGRRIEPSRKARRGPAGSHALWRRKTSREPSWADAVHEETGARNSKGRPNAMRDADTDERSPDERRRSRNPAERKRDADRMGESREKLDDGSYHTP